jgi:uncharacterized protein (TIRG00374 family)
VTRKLVTLAIGLLMLGAIYYKIDIARLAAVFARADLVYLAISLAMVVPLTLLTAWRLQLLAPATTDLGFMEANRLILAASTLNMILPSKMGDIAKAFFMKSERVSGSFTFSLVVFEKTADLLSLLFWCALGLVLYPRKDALFWTLTFCVALGFIGGLCLLVSRRLATFSFSTATRIIPAGQRDRVSALQSSWSNMQEFFWSERGRVHQVSLLSVFIWFLHLLQIWLFILALHAFAPFLASLGLAPLALLAGLLPFTFAGIGTRDAALIFLFRDYFAAPTAAVLGLLCTARYLLPALAGLPFLQRYLGKIAGPKIRA